MLLNPPSLYLIPNFLGEGLLPEDNFPSGNAEIIRSLHHFLAEDPKQARRLIQRVCPEINIRDLSIERMNKHSNQADVELLLAPLTSQKSVGIISDAGCPAIADPGSLAVRYAHKLNITVVPLIGPCSMILALMASGLNGQKWRFEGYIPIEKAKRTACLKSMEHRVAQFQETQIFMETPYRTQKLHDELLETCSPNILLCVAQDITTPTAFIRTSTIGEWKAHDMTLRTAPSIFLLGHVG